MEFTFSPPADIRDFPDEQQLQLKKQWHAELNRQFNPIVRQGGRFFNQSIKGEDYELVGSRTIQWIVFPKEQLVKYHRDDRPQAFKSAEERNGSGVADFKNEYCEWFEYRDDAGKLTSVVFTCEFPEYWQTLWDVSPERVAALYNELLDLPPDELVSVKDLSDGNGRYKWTNPYNTVKGQVHMVQSINTISALMGLLSGSQNPDTLRDNFESWKGIALEFKAADARVVIDLNTLMRKGLHYTLKDPVGMYILDWNDDGWTFGDGSPAGDNWDIIRGNKDGQILRVAYHIPDGQDLYIGGTKVEFGGQIAEHVTVGITGLAAVPKSDNPTS